MATGWKRTLEGRTLAGRYVLERAIGEGGMGAVFAAVQLAVQRRVAVKVLLPGVAWVPGAVERFRREAMLAANVARRGVAQIIDFDHDPVVGPFVVMEQLDGESLADRLKRCGQLPSRDAAWIATSILETLEVVHDRGVIHRDLKPANVFLARESAGMALTVKVLDFGVARVSSPHGEVTARGAVIGTPRYMSPEQAAGAEVDARADVYAVGAILYTCLAAKPYSHVPSEQVLAAVSAGPPPSLAQMNSALPSSLVAVVDRAMARAAEARFPSAGAMRVALLEASHGLPEGLPPSAPPASTTLDASFGSLGGGITATPSLPHSGGPLVLSSPPRASSAVSLGVAVAAILGAGVLVAGSIALFLARSPAPSSPAASPPSRSAATGPDASPAILAEYERARAAWRSGDPHAAALLQKVVQDVEHGDAPRGSPAARVAAEALFLAADLEEKTITPPTHANPPGPTDFGPVTLSPARKQAELAVQAFGDSAAWWIQDIALCATYREGRVFDAVRAMAVDEGKREAGFLRDPSRRSAGGMSAADLRAVWADQERTQRGLAIFSYKGAVALGRSYAGPFHDPTDGADCLASARARLDALTAESDAGP